MNHNQEDADPSSWLWTDPCITQMFETPGKDFKNTCYKYD